MFRSAACLLAFGVIITPGLSTRNSGHIQHRDRAGVRSHSYLVCTMLLDIFLVSRVLQRALSLRHFPLFFFNQVGVDGSCFLNPGATRGYRRGLLCFVCRPDRNIDGAHDAGRRGRCFPQPVFMPSGRLGTILHLDLAKLPLKSEYADWQPPREQIERLLAPRARLVAPACRKDTSIIGTSVISGNQPDLGTLLEFEFEEAFSLCIDELHRHEIAKGSKNAIERW